MKSILLVGVVLALSGCATVTGWNDPGASCLHLDYKSGFARCENNEVVCYVSDGGQNCWPKPAPQPTPVATPAPAPGTPATTLSKPLRHKN